MAQAWKRRALQRWQILIVVPMMAGCFDPAPVNTIDATSTIDARIPDSSIDAAVDARPIDAPPGSNPALARAPKNCGNEAPSTAITTKFPGWEAAVYTGGATADQRFFQCNNTDVYALSSSYVEPRNPFGMQPSIGYARTAAFTGSIFEFAYTVERIDQTGDSVIGFAGGFALSLDPGVAYTVTTIERRPTDGMVMLRTVNQDGVYIATKDIAVLTPPYRVRWRGTRVGAALQSVITIFTATTTTDYVAANVPLPGPDLRLQFGINRYEVGNATRMVISDLVLP